MPRPNRVTPRSELIAVPARGTLMGNRGVLHDAHGRLTGRRWTTRAWVTCRLSFKGRHRPVMVPGRYTELFFLDEATALAAGHRPCGECRREDYRRFKALWLAAAGLAPEAPLASLDRRLHAERTTRGPRGQTHRAALDAIPDGTLVALDDAGARDDAWLVLGGALLRWTPQGYAEHRARPAGATVDVLTPPTTVRVLALGYRPALHASAQDGSPDASAPHDRAQPRDPSEGAP
ncbi:MAG TPA: hypothetical protein VKB51_06480 [bacterium]|nr:hypothetical protein [bacterium]